MAATGMTFVTRVADRTAITAMRRSCKCEIVALMNKNQQGTTSRSPLLKTGQPDLTIDAEFCHGMSKN